MSEGLVNGGRVLHIFVPDEIAFIRPDLIRFFDAMVAKLRRNKHKGRWKDIDLAVGMDKLRHEVEELAEAIKEGSTTEILGESADVGAWAMILANIALEAKGV